MAHRKQPDWTKEVENLQEDVEETQEEADKEEQKEKEEEQQAEQGTEGAEEEVKDAEETGNPAEIKDVEKKEEKILSVLENEEKLAKDIIEKIEKEVKEEEKQEQILEKEQRQIEKEFKDAYKNLREIKKKLKNIKDQGDTGFKKQHFSLTEKALNELKDAAQNYYLLLEYQEELIQEIKETEVEEKIEETVEERLKNELGEEKKVIGEIIKDSEKIKNKEEFEEAEMEGKELSQLVNLWKNETSELQNIDQEIGTEVNEMENILEGDEKILMEMEKSIKELNKIEEMMKEEKGALSFVTGGDKQVNQIITEVDNTRGQLEDIFDKVKKYEREEEKQESKLRKNLSKLGGKGKSALPGSSKVLIIFIALLVGLVAFILMFMETGV